VSSWKANLVSLGLPRGKATYRALSGGRVFSVALWSMERMEKHRDLIVRAGVQSSYRIFRQMWPLE
jgi:hypothetical protein